MIIFVNDNKRRPSTDMIEKAADWNDHGMGIAWREKDEVVWEKGIELDRMKEICATAPVPYVAHFRVASCGGVRPELCHPFPIAKNTSLALKGRTKGMVLFHNGDWKEWAPECREAARGSNTAIPPGKWSDSRAIAWLCSIYGIGYMEWLPTQRGVAFGPKDYEVFSGAGWTKVNEIWCSNDIFSLKGQTLAQAEAATHTAAYHYRGGSMCSFGNCTDRDGLDADNRCNKHPKYLDNYNQASGTQAVSSDTAPFLWTPLGEIISLPQAEKLQKMGKISKNLLKNIRKAYYRFGQDGKEKEKANRALVIATKVCLHGQQG